MLSCYLLALARSIKLLHTFALQALSVNLRQQTLDAAGGNITRLSAAIERSKATDAARLHNEYQRLVSGMQAQGAIPDDNWLANPVLPDDILREAVCSSARLFTPLKQRPVFFTQQPSSAAECRLQLHEAL